MAITQSSRHPLSYRILHELIMGSIIILIATGFYIHRPFVGGGGFLMSMSRGVHNLFAAILIICVITRIVVMFVGKDRDWRSFIPTASDFKLLPSILNYYAYVGKEPVLTKKYNPLQMITYCLAFVFIIFQIFSGFALKYPDNPAIRWFNYSFLNNAIETRIAHFVVTWLFIMFVMIHVYLTIREKFSEIRQMHLLSEAEENEESKESTGEKVVD
jgi:Ni/Fe-hydrogenase 1 B-type cytochrome subunit